MSRPVCHFFHLNRCKKGIECKFSHEPIVPLGYCPNGDSCRVPHFMMDERRNQSKEEMKESISEESVEMIDSFFLSSQLLAKNIKEFVDRFKEINELIQKVIPEQESLLMKLDFDLLFIVDCTGSMGAWIDVITQELSSILSHVKSEFKLSEIRVGFVGYRDFSDGKKQFSVKGFTSDIAEIQKFIGKQKAIGGGDLAEDVIGGLVLGLQQSWQSRARYAILVCDAPSHGKSYYQGDIDDKYPKGDPQGRKLEDLIRQYAKNGIILYGIRINEMTDKMFRIMNEEYIKECGRCVQIANLGNSTKSFGFMLAASISKTLTETSLIGDFEKIDEMIKHLKLPEWERSISSLSFDKIDFDSQKKSDFEVIKSAPSQILKFEFDDKIPDWNCPKEGFKAICHTWFIVKDKDVSINWSKPLIQKSQISTTVWIMEKPFSAGAMRYAFYMKDLALDQKLVGKIPKTLDASYNPEQMMKDIEAIFISTHIINEFNDLIISLVPDNTMIMNFVNCFIYEILDDQFPFKYWWGENYIEGDYEKFNNNAGWESKNIKHISLVAHALSHFSWQYTKGYLMIVDLQGGCGTLTDPQIHCLERNRFGKGNLGSFGIIKFFLSHNCNYLCEKLSLLNPKHLKQEDFDEKVEIFFRNEPQKPLVNEKISKLCDLCRKPYQQFAKDYYEKRRKYPELYCKECEFEKNKEMKERVCVEENCRKLFKFSVFWFKMKRTDEPMRCHHCRIAYRNKMRSEQC